MARAQPVAGGALAPSRFVTGRQKLLTEPMVRVNGAATLKDRILDGRVVLGSSSLRIATSGALDLAENRFRDWANTLAPQTAEYQALSKAFVRLVKRPE